MPRRLVSSEIFRHDKVAELDFAGRLFFIGLITAADDDGRIKGSLKYLKANIFPYDNISLEQIKKYRDQCHDMGIALTYNSNGTEFIWLPGWPEHQSIRADRYKASTLPPPDNQVSTNCQPNDNQVSTQCLHKINKDKLSKDNIIKGDENLSSPFGEKLKELFSRLDRERGYKPSVKRKAEAASMLRMLKNNYTCDQIVETWKRLKSDTFWANKELFMMTVESQIGAMLKNGNNQKPISPRIYGRVIK